MKDPLKKKSKVHTVYKTKDGQKVPGATTILGILDKPALIQWAWKLGTEGIDWRKYRDSAADIGTLAHYLIECDLKGIEPDLDDWSKDQIDLAENCLLSWYEWKKSHEIKTILTEEPLVSENYRFGGTIDCYAEIDGVKTILDFKTGKGIYDTHLYQVCGYAQLLKEHGYEVEAVRILNIPRKETEEFQEKIIGDLSLGWEVFSDCISLYYSLKAFKKGDKA